MSDTLLIILISVGAVALFVIGMSISLMVRGRHIDSEIGDNENMKKLGLKCAIQQLKEEGGDIDNSPRLPGTVCEDRDCKACSSDSYGC